MFYLCYSFNLNGNCQNSKRSCAHFLKKVERIVLWIEIKGMRSSQNTAVRSLSSFWSSSLHGPIDLYFWFELKFLLNSPVTITFFFVPAGIGNTATEFTYSKHSNDHSPCHTWSSTLQCHNEITNDHIHMPHLLSIRLQFAGQRRSLLIPIGRTQEDIWI